MRGFEFVLLLLFFVIVQRMSDHFKTKSSEFLKDLSIDWTILGHSERREIFQESDEVRLKKNAKHEKKRRRMKEIVTNNKTCEADCSQKGDLRCFTGTLRNRMYR